MGWLLDLLLPRRCVLCGAVGAGSDLLCPDCHESDPYIRGGVCPACSKRLDLCRCGVYETHYDGALAAFFYDDAKDGIAALKRFERRDRAEGFARYMAKSFRREYGTLTFDGMLFVPMTKEREGQRGYNQGRELCRRLSKRVGVPVLEKALTKERESAPQKSLDAKGRAHNLRNTFAVRDLSSVKEKTLLLVDDVLTTGATLSECARVLKTAGATAVYCLVAATT